MEKRRQLEANNGEFHLPEPIIHLVQSFLTAKEAARTAILSKSWCIAWSTHPNIDLDIHDFDFDPKKREAVSLFNEFMEFARKTIQRYEQSNLKIESFKIRTQKPNFDEYDRFVFVDDFVNEMITRALKKGATHLITHELSDWYPIVLKDDVFEAENLVGLSVQGCLIDDLGLDQKVRCSKLESLCLKFVEINSAMISNIASCCPLIEKLSLSYEYHDVVYQDYFSLSDLSSKFPSLKDLTLRWCRAQEVSSRTLERLKFAMCGEPGLSVKFDVPSIRKFIFKGCDIFPSLSFVSVSTEWESDVSLTYLQNVHTSWFRGLNKFLTVLSLSKIYLSLDFYPNTSFYYAVGDIRGLTKPEVENLTISITDLKDLSCYALFDGLFRICRPKVITQYLCSKDHLLCKTLVLGLNEKCMCGLQDLEEVNVQLFDEDKHSCCSLTLESLSDALTSAERWKSFLDALVNPKGKRVIRFRFKWKTQNGSTGPLV